MTQLSKKLFALLMAAVMLLAVLPAATAEGEAVYRTLYSGEIGTLNYLTTGTTNEFTVSANIIDTLVERDEYGQIKPALAESWTLSNDDLTWTFTLRDGITWVTAAGEYYADVTAQDFVTAAQYVLDAKNDASNAWILSDYLAGAEDYYSSTELPDEG